MPRLAEVSDIPDRAIKKAAKWYKRIPQGYMRVDPRVRKIAIKSAQGNWSRIEIVNDRTVIVHNDSPRMVK